MKKGFRPWIVLTLALGASLAGCSSMEYAVRESFGQHKREVLVDRVESAKDTQEEAKEQFVSAMEQFKALTGFDGGDLERKYDELKMEFDASEARARNVSKKIDAVEDVAVALFDEWQEELGQYTSPELRQASERQMADTRRSYENLMTLMRAAERRMDPVLNAFRDQVLFLKHNLNARAISSLGGVSTSLEREVDVLIADMERAIADASRFIDEMQRGNST